MFAAPRLPNPRASIRNPPPSAPVAPGATGEGDRAQRGGGGGRRAHATREFSDLIPRRANPALQMGIQ
jgi:hypothetical protein